MKRRNFLSGLLAAPLALKGRFFARKPRMRQLLPHQRQIVQLLAEGKSKEAARVLQAHPLWLRGLKQWTGKPVRSGIFKGMSLN